MGREGTNDLKGRVADVDMAGGGAKEDAVGARSYSGYVGTLHIVSRLVRMPLSFGREYQTSKSGRGGALSASSGALTGVTVKKLKDFHYRHRVSTKERSQGKRDVYTEVNAIAGAVIVRLAVVGAAEAHKLGISNLDVAKLLSLRLGAALLAGEIPTRIPTLPQKI